MIPSIFSPHNVCKMAFLVTSLSSANCLWEMRPELKWGAGGYKMVLNRGVVCWVIGAAFHATYYGTVYFKEMVCKY